MLFSQPTVCIHQGVFNTLYGCLLPRMLENWWKGVCLDTLNFALIFFQKIDILILVSSCYSTRICARALFPYCKPTWFWYSFTSYICPCYALTTQVLVFTSAHVAIIIPPENINLTKQNKNLPHFSSDVWYRTSLYRLRCDVRPSHPGGKFHSKSNMREVHRQS